MGAQLTILDVDTGVDDALAIAYALRSPELKLLGLTTCYGNVTVDEAARNTLIVMDQLGVEGIPVFKGASKPFTRVKQHPRHIHGEHGLGEAQVYEPKEQASDRHAVDFIIEQVHRHPHEMTLIFVGPLTNLALALQQDPAIAGLIGRVVIMGGAVRVPGNVTKIAEANIYSDPEAADIVFKADLPLTVVGLDVTLKTLLPLAVVKQWRECDPKVGGFFADMTEFYIRFYESAYPGIGGCGMHDPLAVGVAIDPSLVTEVPMHIEIETTDETLGKTREIPDGNPNCKVCVSVDSERFLKHFLSRVV